MGGIPDSVPLINDKNKQMDRKTENRQTKTWFIMYKLFLPNNANYPEVNTHILVQGFGENRETK